MTAQQSSGEVTSTLDLSRREMSQSPAQQLAERIAALTDEDREVIAQLRGSTTSKAMIFIARGPNKGSRFLVGSGGVTIGRAAASDVFLDDITVSRRHAAIAAVAKSFVLTDTGSLNGTYIGDELVKEKTLVSGDEFQIGKFHLLFICS